MKKHILRFIVIAGVAILAFGYTQNTGGAEPPEGTETALEVSEVEIVTETIKEATEPEKERYRYIHSEI